MPHPAVKDADGLGHSLEPSPFRHTTGLAGFTTGSATASSVAAEAATTGQVTVLGRYLGGTEAYVGKDGFNVLGLPFKGSGRWNWTRNKRFMDDALERGDELRLVTDPNRPLYSGGNVYQRELKYLQDRGYTWQKTGDYWVVVPRG